MNTDENAITATNVHKYFGAFHALKGISLEVRRGEVVVILGPSGSGKSTFIRAINGLEPFQQGRIAVNGVELRSAINIDRVRGEVGMVFQSFNLFPHLSILDNVALAPRVVRGLAAEECAERAIDLLKRVGIADQSGKFPSQLSGGQQQRAAIARALAMQPKIMLFDEPTSALDPEMIGEVLDVMRDLARSGMTMLIVTHEMGFARDVADRVVFFNEGKILEEAPTERFFSDPTQERSRLFLKRTSNH